MGYARLVPATLLPPEDPSNPVRGPRTVRDWFVDVLLFLVAVGGGLGLFFAVYAARVGPVPDALLTVDLFTGIVATLSLWWRRRYPVVVGAFTAAISAVSAFGAMAGIIGMFTVAVHRRTSVAVSVGVANLATASLFTVIRPQSTAFWIESLVNIAITLVVVAWGMFVRARRQLVWTLRERAERAEAEQRLHAEQARLAERTRIAREMHDVLAHRISLMALHAGGLQVRPELPPDEVRATAGLLRATAQRALEELRSVIGVLREDVDGEAVPAPPQPTLQDIPRLVADTRQAGAKIEFQLDVPPDAAVPDNVGRDAYRIVQEALTNVAKHASGTATSVRVSGAPGAGLRVDVRNRMPLTAARAGLPGSGAGLVGLRERVTLAGGTIEHGPNGDGEFVVDATLAWR